MPRFATMRKVEESHHSRVNAFVTNDTPSSSISTYSNTNLIVPHKIALRQESSLIWFSKSWKSVEGPISWTYPLGCFIANVKIEPWLTHVQSLMKKKCVANKLRFIIIGITQSTVFLMIYFNVDSSYQFSYNLHVHSPHHLLTYMTASSSSIPSVRR